ARDHRRRVGRTRARGLARAGSGARAARTRPPPRRAALVLPTGAGARRHQIQSAVRPARRGVGAGMRRGGGQTVWRAVGRLASALRSAGPPVRLTALLLLSACQPAARRLLLLDLALSAPVLLHGTAPPSRDQGYTVEYRRFYPHRSEERRVGSG